MYTDHNSLIPDEGEIDGQDNKVMEFARPEDVELELEERHRTLSRILNDLD